MGRIHRRLAVSYAERVVFITGAMLRVQLLGKVHVAAGRSRLVLRPGNPYLPIRVQNLLWERVMQSREEAARVRARALGYGKSGLSETELHKLWLGLREERARVYQAVILGDSARQDELTAEQWSTAVTTYCRKKVIKPENGGVLFYGNLIKDLWSFADIYKNSGIWGGDF